MNSLKKQKVHEIISSKTSIKEDEILPEHNFEKDLKVDSLTFVEVVVKIEEYLGIKLRDEDLASIETVKQLDDLIFNTIKN